MRCIVFGATGYLGSKLVKSLVEREDQVLCVIRKIPHWLGWKK